MESGGKLSRKQLIIEFIPRILWLLQFVAHYIVCSNSDHEIQVTNSTFLVILGALLTLTGAFFSAYTFKILSKAMVSKELVRKGAYKYIRHPMYVAMYLLLAGIGFLFFSWIWFVVLLAFVPFWVITMKLEEYQMQSIHPENYKSYKQSSGMILPLLYTKQSRN